MFDDVLHAIVVILDTCHRDAGVCSPVDDSVSEGDDTIDGGFVLVDDLEF